MFQLTTLGWGRAAVSTAFTQKHGPRRRNWKQRFVGAVSALLVCHGFFSLPAEAASSGLQPRLVAPSAETFALSAETPVEQLVIKFHEGTHVRLRDGVLQEHQRSASEELLISRQGLTPSQIAQDTSSVVNILAVSPRVLDLMRLFSQEEAELDTWKASGEQKSGRQQADLNLYFRGTLVPGTSFEDLEEVLAGLNSLASIEVAYAQPPALVASIFQENGSKPGGSSTPNFESFQGYLNPAPQGIDAKYAWTVAGGDGQGVRIVDVERAWNTTHEDLPLLFFQSGVQSSLPLDINHGTSVLGEMVGVDNGFGVKGIAYQAQAGIASTVFPSNTANAIAVASMAVGSGNVVLIEVQYIGPQNPSPCTCNTDQCNAVPVELLQADYDAIASATANGVIVVEAAGNGSVNLDSPIYSGVFDRNVRDSGATMVGASFSGLRSPTCWTNHGSRVDLHGWGEDIATTGGTSLQGGSDSNRHYTRFFGGTSGASPIVAGAVACLQGAARADGQGDLGPLQMRQLLATTGTPQSGVLGRPIGPMPNLRDALEQLIQNEPPEANFTFSGSGLERTFDGSSSTDDQGIVSYLWSFPGSVTKNGVIVNHFFPNYGTHWVTLTVTDTEGGTHTSGQFVTLLEPTITPTQGLWYNPDRSGNGISFNRNSAGDYALFWYTYLPDGTPFWYFSDTGPKVQSTWEQPLYRTSWNGTSSTLTNVGSIKLVFNDSGTAWFSWVLDGQAGGERFAFLHGGSGRTGMWYRPGESGWGTQVAEANGTLVALVAFYQGAEPRWVLGQTAASSNAFMDVLWYNEPGLCPGCGGGSSTPPTGQIVGNTQLLISNGSSTSGIQSVQIQTPGGGGWYRSNISIDLLTEP